MKGRNLRTLHGNITIHDYTEMQQYNHERSILKELVTTIASAFFSAFPNVTADYNTLTTQNPPVDNALIDRVQIAIISYFSQIPEDDENQIDIVNDIIGVLKRMKTYNSQIIRVYPTLPKPSAPPPSKQDWAPVFVPPTPSPSDLPPDLPPLPPWLDLSPPPPLPETKPEQELKAVYRFNLPTETPEKQETAKNFIKELVLLYEIVISEKNTIDGLEETYDPLLQYVHPPTKYDQDLFQKIRDFLNSRITDMLSGEASPVNEDIILKLNKLLMQTHTVMLEFFKLRRVFKLQPVQKKVVQEEKKPKSSGIFWGNELHFPDNDK